MKTKPTIYISGPMTGLPDYNRQAFRDMADKLHSLGYDTRHTANLPDGWAYEDYIRFALSLIRDCEAVLLLPGWETSPGVARELTLAKELKLPVFRSVEDLP